eukprot:GFUD01135869.1.p1 GENE.GFUD01135869.1~~GFUD01135869.1.p1  ORF type:complete len:110 (+),score=45.87 GFUD01135869.1:26-331(+)
MVVHHVTEDTADRECVEDRCKFKNRKRKAGDEEVYEADASVLNSTEEEQSSEKCELSRLQKLIPTMSIKDNVTQLDIILEAIRYIDSLRDRLANKSEGVTE